MARGYRLLVPNEAQYENTKWWYYLGKLVYDRFQTHWFSAFAWVQGGGNFAQNWVNCDTTDPDIQNPNVEWVARHCDSVPNELGMKDWGNSYDIKPSHTTAPIYVSYAIRCEYPADVAPQCLSPHKPRWKVEQECVAKEYTNLSPCVKHNMLTGGSTTVLTLNIARSWI